MLVPVITCLMATAFWFGLVIWAAWGGRWLIAGVGGTLSVLLLVRIAITIGGAEPLFYAPLVGISLFFGSGLVLIGTIAAIAKVLVKGRDG